MKPFRVPVVMRMGDNKSLRSYNETLGDVRIIPSTKEELVSNLSKNKHDVFLTENGCFTYNYDLFVYHFTNRNVDSESNYVNHQIDLADDIECNGQLKTIFVVKSSLGTPYFVADGQNRLISIISKNMPVKFIFTDMPSSLDVQGYKNADEKFSRFVMMHNKKQKTFKVEEELKGKVALYKSFVATGSVTSEKYKKYFDIYNYYLLYNKEFNWSLDRIISLAMIGRTEWIRGKGKTRNRGLSDRFSYGDFEFTDSHKKTLELRASMFRDLIRLNKEFSYFDPCKVVVCDSFVQTVLEIFDMAEYSHEKMLKRMKSCKGQFRQLEEKNKFLIQERFTRIYNSKDIDFVLLSKKYQGKGKQIIKK